MSSFTGFSDADIRKVQNGQDPISKKSANESQNKTISNLSRQKRTNRISVDFRKQNVIPLTKMSLNEPSPIPEEAKLSQPTHVTEVTAIKRNTDMSQIVTTIGTTSNQPEKKFIDLEEFQVKQKLMQEQNRRRKELLAKALEDRTRRTLDEQQRLNEIQNEFRKLDADLSNDVKILRKQIEGASLDYMEAQKRYSRIEKEFLDAKLHLHQKLEKKEMLTEYLCAIIEKNEERKAGRLDELLQKLNVDGAEADVQSAEVTIPSGDLCEGEGSYSDLSL